MQPQKEECNRSVLSLLSSDGRCKDIVRAAQRTMAVDAFAGKRCVLSIRLQVGSTPSRPSPAQGRSIFFAVADHELHLIKRSGPHQSFAVRLIKPCHLCKDRPVRPWMDVVFGNGFYR